MMNNYKKAISLLLSAAVLSAGTLSVSANYYENTPADLDAIPKNEQKVIVVEYGANRDKFDCDGYTTHQSTNTQRGFTFITDGAEPDMAALESIPGFVKCTQLNKLYYDEYPALNLSENDAVYFVDLDSYDAIVAKVRKFSLENKAWVKDACILQYAYYSDCSIYSTGLTVTSNELEKLLSGAIPELDVREVKTAGGTIELRAGLTGSLLEQGAALEDKDDYTKYTFLMSVGAQLQEKYGTDLLTSYDAVPSQMDYSGSETTAPISVWDHFGDSDGDGSIDAVDASKVLQYAAENGNGQAAHNGISLAASDVNMDGCVDAVDASLMLQFSSRYGVDDTAAIFDVLR